MRIKLTLPIFFALILVTQVGGEDADGGHKDRHVSYSFNYGVSSPQTNDFHSQKEYREGDYVVGSYELQEADGAKRIVKYKAGPTSGFEAVVERVHPKGVGFRASNNLIGGGGGFGMLDGFSDFSGVGKGFGFGSFEGLTGRSIVGTTKWGNQFGGGYGGYVGSMGPVGSGYWGGQGLGAYMGFGGYGDFGQKY